MLTRSFDCRGLAPSLASPCGGNQQDPTPAETAPGSSGVHVASARTGVRQTERRYAESARSATKAELGLLTSEDSRT